MQSKICAVCSIRIMEIHRLFTCESTESVEKADLTVFPLQAVETGFTFYLAYTAVVFVLAHWFLSIHEQTIMIERYNGIRCKIMGAAIKQKKRGKREQKKGNK